MTSRKKSKCSNHEEVELILTVTDKNGIEHEQTVMHCLNCKQEILFNTENLCTPDIDIPTLEVVLKVLEQDHSKMSVRTHEIGFKKAIKRIHTLKTKLEHPEWDI